MLKWIYFAKSHRKPSESNKSQITKYKDLEIQFWSVNAQLLLGCPKISSNFSFLPKQYKAITVCWCKQPYSKSFQMCLYCIYLLKLYYKSIIILLTNNLTNIWNEISKSRLILWMVYIWNVKRLEEVEKLGRNVLCIVDQEH